MSPTIRIIRQLTAAMNQYDHVFIMPEDEQHLPGHQRTTAEQDIAEAMERFPELFESAYVEAENEGNAPTPSHPQWHQLNPKLRALATMRRDDPCYLALIDDITMHPDFDDDTLDLCFAKFKNNPCEYRDLELRGAMIVYSYLDA